MSTNPLFPDNPLRPEPADSAAVELIRSKVAKAFGEEPLASQELQEIETERVLSKHQVFLQQLAAAGKGLAEIQTEWHAYYTRLPEAEKHEVWQEFYAANEHTPYQKLFQKQTPVASRSRLAASAPETTSTVADTSPRVITSEAGVTIADHTPLKPIPRVRPVKPNRLAKTKKRAGQAVRKTKVGKRVLDSQTAEATRRIKHRIQHKVSAGGKLKARHHLQSLLFGFGVGAVMLLVLLFGFFNEFIITPFIQPSSKVAGIPIIVSNISPEQAANPTVIVSKINIQMPVDFNLISSDEATIQSSLENGVVHYPSTVKPGENGNSAYFGHSSQNIFNNGKAKFAFVRLRELTTGDVFTVLYNGKVYSYEVFAKEIVPPSQVSVLTDTKGEQATAVLITCDPPGFSTNRLVVWGKQISPSVASNNTPTTQPSVAEPQQITSNGPTLWTRMWRGIQFWN
ncbi:sortase [Candidatus Saccharibacteria bacterium]|nr:MAG: sortase [Candidatus Saccharibacteria bacterium]